MHSIDIDIDIDKHDNQSTCHPSLKGDCRLHLQKVKGMPTLANFDNPYYLVYLSVVIT
jgi:hypothetical protein